MAEPLTKEFVRFLNQKVEAFEQPEFVKDDPVSIPHLFKKKQDIEIAGFFAAIFAWGIRKTIINKSVSLMEMMHNAPYDFCLHHTDKDLQKIQHFSHRTFNGTDLLYFISFFKEHYSKSDTLESAFFNHRTVAAENKVEAGLNYFHDYFFSLPDVPGRTLKHIAAPKKNSACKRLNMYLRWMVRHNDHGVDFGMWNKIHPSDLICPLDVHVARVARHFQLLTRKQTDWTAAMELTENLKKLDASDPVKYDFALFGLGVIEKY